MLKLFKVGLSLLLIFIISISSVFAETTESKNLKIIAVNPQFGDNHLSSLPVPNARLFRDLSNEVKQSAEESILELLGGTKLFNEAKTWYDEAPDDSLFEANIVLNFEVDTSNFENKLIEVFGDSIVYQKIHNRRYYMVINKKQADRLQAMEEVLLIASANEKMHVNVPDWNPINSPIISPMSNSTRLTGADKARTDFKVTGDVDGIENSYSNYDVVIAVLDSGIDTNHESLKNGKVIGWFDAVNGRATPYDDNGHGTAVASIIAGASARGVGYAPGAALVGVKVLDSQNRYKNSDLLAGLQWVYNNRNTFNIDAVNLSLQTNDPTGVNSIRSEIARLNSVGIPVFTIAGNYGAGEVVNGYQYYNTINLIAIGNPFIVGNVMDPMNGGWGLHKTSSRGTDVSGTVTGPTITAPGTNVEAAVAGTTNGYGMFTGTSFAAPAMSGTYALMLDAAVTSGSFRLAFHNKDRGPAGTDKLFGNGILRTYESVQYSANTSSGSFDDGFDYGHVTSTVPSGGYITVFPVEVYNTSVPFNITAYTLNENGEELDLYIWYPGRSPYDGVAADEIIRDSDPRIPQRTRSFSSPRSGIYYIGITEAKGRSLNFHVDLHGKIR